MAETSASSVFLMILNIVHVLFGLSIAIVSIWFFVEVQSIANMRNPNHYMLNFNVYWPQGIPWVFFFAAILVLLVSCCGFFSAKKQKRGVVLVYIVFQILAILALVTSAAVALALADSQASDNFMKDSIWDAFNYMKDMNRGQTDFQLMERRFQCCGAHGPRDYVNWNGLGGSFPTSCCDDYYSSISTRIYGQVPIVCDSTNKLANERHGCSEVASNYARIVMRALSAVAVFTALIGLINLFIASCMYKGLKERKPRMNLAPNESESKKVLL